MSDNWACISKNEKYRYSLGRQISKSSRRLLFIMLNPSKADAQKDDRTISKCTHFTRKWGYGTLEVVNLFAWRSQKPAILLELREPIGKDNDDYIRGALQRADKIVLAWGDEVRKSDTFMLRAGTVFSMAHKIGSIYHLGLTNAGEPRHPVPRYVPYDATPVKWTKSQIAEYLRTHS